MIVDSLNSIGFKHLDIKGDLIEFKSDMRDQHLESFQRKYGNGKISFQINDKCLKITVIPETKHNFKISLILTLILIVLMIYFGLSNDKKITDLLIFGSALIISFIFEYLINSSLIKHKQNELLKLINEKIKIASH
jgi:hypothetical protein